MDEVTKSNEQNIKISFEENAKGLFQMKVTAYGLTAEDAAENADKALKLARDVMAKNEMKEVGVF